MNIRFIAMGLLTAAVFSTAVYADDMQQNMQQGTQATQGTMTGDQSKNMGAMPIPQGTTPTTQNTQGTMQPAATAGTTTTTTTTTGTTTGNTTQTGTY
jgi:hypothetical protein